jgi:flagellar basal body P-ring protein FlgI
MARKIKVIIDKKTGKVRIDYNGFIGDECFEEAGKLKEILESLGVDVQEESIERKPSAYAYVEEQTEEKASFGW